MTLVVVAPIREDNSIKTDILLNLSLYALGADDSSGIRRKKAF